MKILIADDDPDLTRALAMRCRQKGWTTLVAHEGFEALALARVEKPNVLCLDVEMPSGRGLAVSEMMRTDGDFLDTPLVILTGRTDPHTIRRCHELGLYYVQKCTNSWERLEPVLDEVAVKVAQHEAEFIKSL